MGDASDDTANVIASSASAASHYSDQILLPIGADAMSTRQLDRARVADDIRISLATVDDFGEASPRSEASPRCSDLLLPGPADGSLTLQLDGPRHRQSLDSSCGTSSWQAGVGEKLKKKRTRSKLLT